MTKGRGVAELLAGIDVGTTNCKVGVYTPDGAVVVEHRRATPSDADSLVASVLDALRRCVDETGPPAAIGITGVAEGGVPLDGDLRAMRPLLWWHDDSAAEQARWLADSVGAEAIFATTGVFVAPRTPLATWLRLRRDEPGCLDRMRVWVGVPELVATTLCDEPLTDRTLAGRSGAFDQRRDRWDEDLLALAGLHPARFPDRAAGHTRSGVPVVVTGHDHLVAAYAADIREPGDVADSLGTMEAVVTVARRPPDEGAGSGMSWNRTADGAHWAMISGFPHSGRLVDWLCSLAGGDHARLDELAATVRRPTGIVVLPYLAGRAAPAPDPHRRLSVHGLDLGHGLPDVLVAVLEGACHHVRWMAERQAELGGIELGPVAVLGGPSRGRALTGIKAHVMPGPVRRVHADAACAGAALLAGRAVGLDPRPLRGDVLPRDDVLAARYDLAYRDFLSRASDGVLTVSGSEP
jgi:xylulokinase